MLISNAGAIQQLLLSAQQRCGLWFDAAIDITYPKEHEAIKALIHFSINWIKTRICLYFFILTNKKRD